MSQPIEVDLLSEQIRALYADADRQLAALQSAIADDPARWRAQRRLRDLRATIDTLTAHLDDQARTWVANDFPRGYSLGAATTSRTVGATFTWSRPHLDAVTALAQDLFDDLLTATRGVRASTKRLIGRLARQQATTAIVGGETATRAGSVLADLLEQRGIWAVRYRDGSLHSIGDYSDMVIRTKTATAYVSGSLNGAPDVAFWECADGSGCGLREHEDPEKANGLIASRDTALAYPLAHPRCRRAWLARPDVTSAADASAATPSTTAAQRADQAAAEQARAERLAARRAKAQRTGAMARRQEILARRERQLAGRP